MSDKKSAWFSLNNLIEDYAENKSTYSVEKLQDIREDISLQLFKLTDVFSEYIASYEMAEHVRKSFMAEREQYWRTELDDNGKLMTIAEASNRARIESKKQVEDVKEALRKKKRAEIVLMSVQQILNAISSKINSLKN